MRTRWLFALILMLIALAATAQTQPPQPAATKTFAPYVDMGKFTGSLAQVMKSSGARIFTLSFVQSQGCSPAWVGATPAATDAVIMKQVAELRAAGGDVVISFGGYDGTDIAQACSDAQSLQAAYQSVIDKYKLKFIDLDVEHLAIEDPTSIDRRSQALKALAAANPGLQINYTLPANPQGLTKEALNVIKSAVSFGTPVTIVNLMTMDYGYPVANGAMGVDAVSAAGAAWVQLKNLGLNARLGFTPMIGTNDTTTETFGIADAQAVFAFAQANPAMIGWLSFWSSGRDNGSCSAVVSPTCSGIAQKEWEFSRIFAAFQQ